MTRSNARVLSTYTGRDGLTRVVVHHDLKARTGPVSDQTITTDEPEGSFAPNQRVRVEGDRIVGAGG